MSFLINSYRFGAGAAFDADYQAILDYATAQGYTLPSSGQQTIQNALVVSLKSEGVWGKLDCFYNRAVDGNADFACINWKSPGNFNSVRVNSPAFITNQGFQGNGVDAHLLTGFVPSAEVGTSNFQQNSAFLGYLLHSAGTSIEAAIYSSRGSTGPFFGNRITGNRTYANISTTGFLASATGLSVGVLYGILRSASDAQSVYTDGVLSVNNTTASTGVPTTEFSSLANAFLSQNKSDATVSFEMHGGALTATEIAALNTLLKNYKAAI
jgi:hypothetical protein